MTLCGSMSAYSEMERIQKELIGFGHEVKIPELALEVPESYGGGRKLYFGEYIRNNGSIDAFPAGHEIWNLKEGAVRDHFEKIEWCDNILVVNEEKHGLEGYVGGNTLIEIGLAFYLKKGIFILREVAPQLTYKQEIMGMKPWILDGSLWPFRKQCEQREIA